MRRNFTNERDYLNTVEQDRCAPPCCLNPPRPKPPPKPDTGFDCTCRTENCKVKFSTVFRLHRNKMQKAPRRHLRLQTQAALPLRKKTAVFSFLNFLTKKPVPKRHGQLNFKTTR